MGRSRALDSAAYAVAKGQGGDASAADDTFIEGAIIDTATSGAPESGTAFACVNFTSSSGAAGGKLTVTLTVEDGDNSALSDKADFKSMTYDFDWAADGANAGVIALPVQLAGAKRYVRVKAKGASSGTITIDELSVSVFAELSGLSKAPDAAFVQAGYQSTTEAS